MVRCLGVPFLVESSPGTCRRSLGLGTDRTCGHEHRPPFPHPWAGGQQNHQQGARNAMDWKDIAMYVAWIGIGMTFIPASLFGLGARCTHAGFAAGSTILVCAHGALGWMYEDSRITISIGSTIWAITAATGFFKLRKLPAQPAQPRLQTGARGS